MKNFQPGGLRNRRDDIGGRPQRDINNYAPRNRRDDSNSTFKKPFERERSNYNPKDRAPREQKSYPAVCSTCSKTCDVPFRPDGVKPVLCRECYSMKSQLSTNMSSNRDRFTENEKLGHKPPVSYATPLVQSSVSTSDYAFLLKQLQVVETKVSQILDLIQASEKLIVELPSLPVNSQSLETEAIKKPIPKKTKVTKAAPKTKAAKKAAPKAVKKTTVKKATKK